MTRAAGMVARDAAVGSTLARRVPASAPPCSWKYQHGMPFCIVTTAVSASNSLGTFARHGLDLVRLHREDHDVVRAGRRVVVSRVNVVRDELRSVTHHELHAVAAKCGEIGATRDERDVLAGERELDAHVTADGAGADDCDLHDAPERRATERRRWWSPLRLLRPDYDRSNGEPLDDLVARRQGPMSWRCSRSHPQLVQIFVQRVAHRHEAERPVELDDRQMAELALVHDPQRAHERLVRVDRLRLRASSRRPASSRRIAAAAQHAEQRVALGEDADEPRAVDDQQRADVLPLHLRAASSTVAVFTAVTGVCCAMMERIERMGMSARRP